MQDTKNEIKHLKELRLKFEIGLSGCVNINNKSSSGFQDIYSDGIYAELKVNYKINQFFSIGLGGLYSKFKTKPNSCITIQCISN